MRHSVSSSPLAAPQFRKCSGSFLHRPRSPAAELSGSAEDRYAEHVALRFEYRKGCRTALRRRHRKVPKWLD